MSVPTPPFRTTLGDRLTPLARTLIQAGAPVDLTGATVEFKLSRLSGTSLVVEIDWTTVGVTIVDAVAGKVKREMQAAEWNTLVAGEYRAWYRVTKAGKVDTFPADGRSWKVFVATTV